MKTFKEYLTEAAQIKIYHTSKNKISSLKSDPMWFAIKLSHAVKGWHKNNKDEGLNSFVYETTLNGKIAKAKSKVIQNLFIKNDVDLEDYVIELVGNPSAAEVKNMDGTKLLIKNGYDGIQYDDYDPRDFSNDLAAILLFNPKKSSRGWDIVHN